MIKCISIYPTDEITESLIEQWSDYINTARKYGFNEVFTSLHLPEVAFENQLSCLSKLARLAHEAGMLFTFDIGGAYISKALDNEAYLEQLKAARADYIRLDYGYKNEEVLRLNENLKPKGFEINASMYDEQTVDEKVAFFKQLDVEVRACHNFYPRVESGLSENFAHQQDAYFRKHNVPVIYFIPSLKHPRGPVFAGLPTIEEHREMSLTLIMLELLWKYRAEGIMLADEFFEEEQFKEISAVLEKKPIPVKVELYDETIKPLVSREHRFRYDSNELILRSESSREMSQYASKVEPFNCAIRHRGDITVDNYNYGRYSGEVEVVLAQELRQDERVNVAGRILNEEDLKILGYYQYGYLYDFISEDK